MAHFLVFWGRHWGTGFRPSSVGTGSRIGEIKTGDEIFVLLTNSREGLRVVAHGYAAGTVFNGVHYQGHPDKTGNWVDVDWDSWLSDSYGLTLEEAKKAAPSFSWHRPVSGSRIKEGDSLREAWQQHLDSLPETAFITQPDKPSATIDRTQTHNTLPAPTVRVDFHEVVSGPDLWGGGTFQADRHYLAASSVHQDQHETIFVRSSGEIAYRWPTSKIQSIKWLGEGGGSHQREPAPPSRPQSPQATTAKTSPQSEGEPAPIEDETFTPEMIAKRREILEQAGSGTPNWDGALYRSLMDEAGIPHSESPPQTPPPSPDADSPTIGTSSTTSRPPARAGESWSEDEEDLLVEQVRAGANLNDIVRKHERSEGAIRSRLEKLNLVTHDSEIVHLFDGGWTIDELAGTFGVESNELYERFIRSGINPKRSAPTGVRRSDSDEASRPVINEMQSKPASKQPKKKTRQRTRRSRAEKPMENTDPYLSASGSGMVRNWGNRKARPAVTSDERAICKACDRPAMNCAC